MTLPNLATVDQLETRLNQSIPPSDSAQAEWMLGYASALIRAHTGRDYVDDEGQLVVPLPSGIAEVCVEMVFRAVVNPEGVTQDTTGPFTVSFGSDAAQRIYLSSSDKTILGGANRKPKLWTQPTTRGDIETDTVYVPVSNGGEPLPLLADPPY